jgi:phosphinothricin acetyltransferase
VTALRLASEADAAAVAAVYAPYVLDTVVSFEAVPPSPAEMRGRMVATLARWPWLLATDVGDAVVGYAYASAHHERAAYRWSVDVTVYLDAANRRRGIGRALYTALLAVVRAQGYQNAYAGITLPNAGSVGLHEVMGFRPVGVYQSVGFKHGAWHDVGYWHLALGATNGTPAEPLTLDEVRGTAAWTAALGA